MRGVKTPTSAELVLGHENPEHKLPMACQHVLGY